MAKSVSLWKVKPTSWCRVVMFCFTSSVSKSTMLNMPSSGEAPMMARHSFTTHSSPTQLSGLVVSSFPSSLQAINPPLIRAIMVSFVAVRSTEDVRCFVLAWLSQGSCTVSSRVSTGQVCMRRLATSDDLTRIENSSQIEKSRDTFRQKRIAHRDKTAEAENKCTTFCGKTPRNAARCLQENRERVLFFYGRIPNHRPVFGLRKLPTVTSSQVIPVSCVTFALSYRCASVLDFHQIPEHIRCKTNVLRQ